MGKEAWRLLAKTSAWIDLVLQCTVLVVVSAILLYRHKFTGKIEIYEYSVYIWMVLIACIIFQFVQMYVAMKLIIVTSKGLFPYVAKDMAASWTIARLIFFVVSLLNVCFFQQNLLGMSIAIWYGCSIVIVYVFVYSL